MNLKCYTQYDGLGLAKLVKEKQVSAIELIEDAFEQINELNPKTNAVVRTRFEKAMMETGKSESIYGPFAGVPILLKDLSQSIKGEPITAGSKLHVNRIAKRDSNFVKKIREAGFVIIGQTSSPEFGLKNITEPAVYGATRNPWNLQHSSGGSSGGASASITSGMVPISGASDGGGSIRIPASFTGLVGLKPTRGRTPVGPGVGRQWHGAAVDFALTKTVRDSAAMLDALQIIQPDTAFQVPLYNGSYLKELSNPLKERFKIAFSTKSPVGTPVSEEAVEAVHKTVKWLEQAGFTVEECDNGVDGIRLMENYYIMNSGEMAAGILSIEEAIGRPITVNDIEIVTWVLRTAGQNVSAVQFTRSLAEWDTAAAQMARFNEDYDLYLTPATAFSAPKVGELTHTDEQSLQLLKVNELKPSEQLAMVYEMFKPSLTYTPFTQLANIIGQPAISLPVHMTDSGLPLGVQLMAPKGREDWLLKIGALLEQSDIWVGQKGNPYIGWR
ncbi:amidase [Pradoshia sp. D12]|uniref:amidase n=1 Tax=Bacillaceae TaxID=186817 RepID=UPI00112BC3B6|nr:MULTISPECIES: amidase [Bacillaceae]QFK71200.1 amidase [Pradoshia sp. D12]TPF72993.1 amidase [Bacillus sp. D12]